VPKDPPAPKLDKPLVTPAESKESSGDTLLNGPNPPGTTPSTPGGKVSVAVDTVARPGALVSGSVSFSDGQSALWHLDQMGRLGLAPKQPGYKPSAADVQSFQQALEAELSKIGF
jgi:hypothetical protein